MATSFRSIVSECTEYECPDGKCLEYSKQCDGVIDCDGGADEENCPTGKWKNAIHIVLRLQCIIHHVCRSLISLQFAYVTAI